MTYHRLTTRSAFGWLATAGLLSASLSLAAVVFTRDFAALEGCVKPVEQPHRHEVCLNGGWQFQPVKVPAGYQRDQGIRPELPAPGDAWEPTPIRIPSPWNLNTYGAGRETRDFNDSG